MNKCTKPHCGKALDDDAAFCPYCGHESKFKIKGIVTSSFIDFSSSTECNVATNDALQDFNKTCIDPNHFTKAKDDEASVSKEKQRQAEVFPVFV